jgi:hypothetical protein
LKLEPLTAYRIFKIFRLNQARRHEPDASGIRRYIYKNCAPASPSCGLRNYEISIRSRKFNKI